MSQHNNILTNPHPNSTSTGTGTGTDASTGYTFATQPPPSHHVHKSSDVLPGARGAAGQQAPPDYSMDVTENSRVWQEPQDSDQHERTTYGAGSDTRQVVPGGQHDYDTPKNTQTASAPATGAGAGSGPPGHGAYSEDRPQPTEQGECFFLAFLRTSQCIRVDEC